MTIEAPNSYDEVPYPSHPYPLTHPDWLATVGALFGLDPPPVDRCRVLELGCASGGNLLPMAATLPDSQFVGVDLSARQIATGRAWAVRAGLGNVELTHGSILDVDDAQGQFDYVICYGVFSWVPRPVQDKILAICSRHLAPHGIAYVNYNTYPGGHTNAMMREMMRFAAREAREPAAKMARAWALIDLLAEGGTDATLRAYAKEFSDKFRAMPAAFVYHEFLEAHNERLYFLDFLSRVVTADLQYLGEAHVPGMFWHQFVREDLQPVLATMAPTLVLREQYLDLLRNRTFRQTLVCRKGIPVNHDVDGRALAPFHFRGQFTPIEPVAIDAAEPAVFEGRDGVRVETQSPITKAILVSLNEAWPEAVPCDVLAGAVQERAGVEASADVDAASIAGRLWYFFERNLVEIRSSPDRFRVEPDEWPRATALARLQATTDAEVVNLCHERVQPDAFARRVLVELDGASNRTQIVGRLGDAGEGGRLEAMVDAALRHLGSLRLLMR